MSEQESFEERRGKYIYSKGEGPFPESFNLEMTGNSFYNINNGRAKFSITINDAGDKVFVDMRDCEVRPVGDYDTIARRLKRTNVLMFIVSSALIFVSLSNAGLI